MPRFSTLAFAAALSGGCPLAATAQTSPLSRSSVAQNAMLTVAVSGLRNAKGQIIIWVWNSPEGFPKQGGRSYRKVAIDADKAASGSVTTTFALPPGTYGVTALHDENRNGDMDTNFLGIPKEGVATSNNVVTHFGAPSYKQVSFAVPASGEKIAIALRY